MNGSADASMVLRAYTAQKCVGLLWNLIYILLYFQVTLEITGFAHHYLNLSVGLPRFM